jgi:pimeloyl-ACP methyl ester carboxylesterase
MIRALFVRALHLPDVKSTVQCLDDIQHLAANGLHDIFSEVCDHLFVPMQLTEVRVPTLVVAGEKESEAMKQSVTDVAGLMPNARSFIIPRADHGYPWRMPDAFNKLIAASLN